MRELALPISRLGLKGSMGIIRKIICNLLSIFSPLVTQVLSLSAVTMALIYMSSGFIEGIAVTLTDNYQLMFILLLHF